MIQYSIKKLQGLYGPKFPILKKCRFQSINGQKGSNFKIVFSLRTVEIHIMGLVSLFGTAYN